MLKDGFVKLNERLHVVTSFVKKGSVVADIGTDHALLPIYLLQQGISNSVIACDVKKGPLNRAKKAVEETGLTNQISCRLGDGLEPLKEDEVDTIVIAGMGGETIVNILSSCQWTKNKNLRFIFQPMTHSEVLRSYLYQNGFCIEKEKVIREDSHLYTIQSVAFTGQQRELSIAESYLGKIGEENKSIEEIQYIEGLIKRFTKKKQGLLRKIEKTDEDEKEIRLIEECVYAFKNRVDE